MNSKEKEMRRLIQKLETQNDISFEEVKWIHALMGSLIETISKMPLPTSMSDAEELELQNSLSKDYPILALKDWHDAVARKIKAGYSGNFIFTLCIKCLKDMYKGWNIRSRIRKPYHLFISSLAKKEQTFHRFDERFSTVNFCLVTRSI